MSSATAAEMPAWNGMKDGLRYRQFVNYTTAVDDTTNKSVPETSQTRSWEFTSITSTYSLITIGIIAIACKLYCHNKNY